MPCVTYLRHPLQIMWDNGSKASPFFIVAFYAFSHYCSAVTMFKELDLCEAGGTYFSDVLTLFQRCMDVLFYDIQMVASVVHSNRMLEGMTQVRSIEQYSCVHVTCVSCSTGLSLATRQDVFLCSGGPQASSCACCYSVRIMCSNLRPLLWLVCSGQPLSLCWCWSGVCFLLQVAFKGYEEARVALTCLLFTMPCCIIIGVEYGVFMNGELKLTLKVRTALPVQERQP